MQVTKFTEKVRGVEFEISVNDDGHFYTIFDNREVRRKTLKELRQALNSLTGQKSLDIPCVRLERGGKSYWHSGDIKPTKCVITAITGLGHSSAVMVKYPDGKKEREYFGGMLRSTASVEKVKQLYAAKVKAEKAYNDYVDKHSMKWEEVLKVAEKLGVGIEVTD